MTNKVKPFYIRITDDITPQMVQDAFDKCRELGVKDTELCDSLDYSHWVYFGVCGRDGLYYSDYHDNFHGDAQEITLDQLDGWLGLEVKQEWDGKGLPPVGVDCEFKEGSPSGVSEFSDWSKCRVLAYNKPKESSGELQIIVRDDRGDAAIIYSCDEPVFRKPETPEQKAEREKREEAKEMIQCLLDNYTKCEESAIEYVIDYLKECESLRR